MNNIVIEFEKIEVNGKKYNTKFTVQSAYYIEQQLKRPLFDILREMSLEDKEIVKKLTIFMKSMVKISERETLENDLIYKSKAEDYIRYYFFVTNNVMNGLVPDKSEEDNIADYIEEEVKEHGEYDFPERMFTLGHVLGYRDAEIWKMSPRTLIALHRDYSKYQAGDPPRKQAADFI